MRRVAITGMGVISPLGNDVDTLFTRVAAGESAVRQLALPRFGARPVLGAPAGFDGAMHFEGVKLRMLDRVSQMAVVAAAQAIAESGLDFAREDPERCGVSVGSSLGGAQTSDDGYFGLYGERSERVQPLNVVAGSMHLRHGSPSSTGRRSALIFPPVHLRQWPWAKPHAGSSTPMSTDVAGGPKRARRGVLRAWDAMRTLALPDPVDVSASCRPFAKTRTGLVIGEGAAFLVLEEWEHAQARGADIHAEFKGYGLTNDPGHITRPSVAGQASAMRAALRSAALGPVDLHYINAHGTATQQNDAVETAAIRQTFGAQADAIPVSSTKAVHAHLLGAAGALEFVIAVAAMGRGLIPPTLHLNVPDPACDLDYVAGEARDASIRAVMSNSFAFGGTNAVLIAGVRGLAIRVLRLFLHLSLRVAKAFCALPASSRAVPFTSCVPLKWLAHVLLDFARSFVGTTLDLVLVHDNPLR